MSRDHIGPYRMLRRCGEGASSTVLEAIDERTGERVALKVPHPDRASHVADREHIRHEAERAAAVRHEGVVHVRGTVGEGNLIALVLDYVDGAALPQLVPPPLSDAAVAALGTALARSLAAIHDARNRNGVTMGLVHGDVSPGNVLVRRDGMPMLTDFGLARRRLVSAVSDSGLVRGTPGFVAPEVLRGGEPTPSSDQFGLGAVLFHALVGRPPFEGRTALDVMRATVESTPSVPSGPMGEIIAQAMHKRPERRFPGASALSYALAPLVSTDGWDLLSERVRGAS